MLCYTISGPLNDPCSSFLSVWLCTASPLSHPQVPLHPFESVKVQPEVPKPKVRPSCKVSCASPFPCISLSPTSTFSSALLSSIHERFRGTGSLKPCARGSLHTSVVHLCRDHKLPSQSSSRFRGSQDSGGGSSSGLIRSILISLLSILHQIISPPSHITHNETLDV